jgi:hypothetical protein
LRQGLSICQCAEARGAGGMVAASRAQHAPVILLLQRMRHKARVRVVASKQCAAPCCVCRSVGAQGDGGDGDVDGDGVMVMVMAMVMWRADSRVLQQVTGSDTHTLCVLSQTQAYFCSKRRVKSIDSSGLDQGGVTHTNAHAHCDTHVKITVNTQNPRQSSVIIVTFLKTQPQSHDCRAIQVR